jgi:hypothetical protein
MEPSKLLASAAEFTAVVVVVRGIVIVRGWRGRWVDRERPRRLWSLSSRAVRAGVRRSSDGVRTNRNFNANVVRRGVRQVSGTRISEEASGVGISQKEIAGLSNVMRTLSTFFLPVQDLGLARILTLARDKSISQRLGVLVRDCIQ